MSKALFLDRDGTLIYDKDYLSDPVEVELIPGAREALKTALQAGYKLFLFTNQSGVGRGWYTLEDVHACNQRMLELLGLPEPVFVEVCIAPETPEQPQVYRKPSPNFILEMLEKHGLEASQCHMVGDRSSDLEAGLNAGVKPVLLRTGKPVEGRVEALVREHGIPVYEDLRSFVGAVI